MIPRGASLLRRGSPQNANVASFAYAPDGERASKAFGGNTTSFLGNDAELLPYAANSSGLLTSNLHPDVKREVVTRGCTRTTWPPTAWSRWVNREAMHTSAPHWCGIEGEAVKVKS